LLACTIFNKVYEISRSGAGEDPMPTVDPLFDPRVIEEPYAYYAHLRDRDPVHHVEGTNTFLVSRLSLIHEVASDPATYSSQTSEFLFVGSDGEPGLRSAVGVEIADFDALAVIATADPPKHGRQRRVLTRVLSSAAIARREAEFRMLVDAALTPHFDRGAVEWMGAIAEPLPTVVLARILGVPDEAAPFLKEFGYASVEQIGGFASEDRCSEIRARMVDLGPVADAYGRARRGDSPGPDTVIGACADAVAAGEVDDLEAISILMLLVSAGSESTTSLLGTGARILAEDQALQQRLRENPALLTTYVEEACRVDPPFRGHYRRATRDTTLNGVAVPAGARVVLLWPAANRDSASFEHPDEIDLDRRSPREHVGFGWGIHLCVGAPLARLEARVVFERLLARTSRFEVDLPTRGPSHHHSLMIRRLVELPLILRQ
jgi:cytochrome P450